MSGENTKVSAEVGADPSRDPGRPASSVGDPLRVVAGHGNTLADALTRAALAGPDRGVLCIDDEGQGRFQPYAELLETGRRLLGGLLARGARPGDHVLIQAAGGHDFTTALWLSFLGGMLPVPLAVEPTFDASHPTVRKLVAAAGMSESPWILTSDEHAAALRSLVDTAAPGARVVGLSELGGHTPAAVHEARPEDPALLLLTSGSTGRPKVVALSHQNVLSMTRGFAQMGGFTETDVPLNWMPMEHVGAIVSLSLLAVDLGARQIHVPTDRILRDPLRWLALIEQHRASVSWAPNFAFALVNSQEQALLARRFDLSSMRFLINAGEQVGPKAMRRFLSLLQAHGLPPDALRPAFGMSETSSGITYSAGLTLEHLSREQSYLSLGRPIPGARVRIADEHDRGLAEGTIGRLQVHGPSVMKGYYQDEERTRASFTADGWFVTGDMGYLQDGELFITGRDKQDILVNGNNFPAHEIEALVEEVEGVRTSFTAAFAMRDAAREREVLVVVFSPTNEDPAAWPALVRQIRGRLARGMGLAPEHVLPLEPGQVPKTSIGKIQRALLRRDMEQGLFDAQLAALRASMAEEAERSADGSGRLTATERRIADIWAAVLGAPRVGRHDNFFELGGHSLLLIQAQTRMKEELGRSIALTDLFRYPTVAALAEHLDGEGEGPSAVREAEARAQARKHAGGRSSDIAVVGIACRFPGAHGPEQLWHNLRNGVESISFFSEQEVAEAGIPEKLYRHPDYVRAKPIIEDVESFDAAFFGYSPREAELLDPQQRLLLECAWECLEHAGYDPRRYEGSIGLFAGGTTNTYVLNNWYPNREAVHPETDMGVVTLESGGGFQMMVASDKDYLPMRVSYKLNLRGPSVNVQTACSTSLVAVHMAAQSLRQGECDMAMAAGASLNAPQKVGYLYQEGMIVSRDGHCRAFDADATGTIFGNGAGAVLLKRLDDALADGDTIFAVIKGTAVNNDGADKLGFLAPGLTGQTRVMAEALAMSGVDPATIGMVEAHGTATPMGDPVEVEALGRVLRAYTDRKGFCALGSIKTNVGHLQITSGIAGFIKAVLSLHHREIPPSLHFQRPNPNIDLESSPFHVNTRLLPWSALEQDGVPVPRRAGVNSLGIGGTNAHVILEEAPPVAEPAAAAEQASSYLLPLSAKDPQALVALARAYRDHLARAGGGDHLSDIARTASLRRAHHEQRLAVVGRSKDEIAAALGAFASGEAPAGVVTGEARREPAGRVFVFSGQGSQWAGMGRQLHAEQEVFRSALEACDAALVPHTGFSVIEQLGQPEETSRLAETAVAQPALFAVEVALAALLASWGVTPDAVIGHSVGEIAAAHVAGILDLDEAARLVALRGQTMQKVLTPGTMVSVGLGEEEAHRAILGFEDRVSIAAINDPGQVVLSGETAVVDDMVARLSARGVTCRPLRVSYAFHSPQVEPARAEFVDRLGEVARKAGRIPMISTVTGAPVAGEALDAVYWGSNLRQAVRFAAAVESAATAGYGLFIEVGPHPVLSADIEQTLAIRGHSGQALSTLRRRADERMQVLALLGSLYVRGHEVDWARLLPAGGRVVELPTYPWQRRRHWIEPTRASQPMGTARAADKALPGRLWELRWERSLRPTLPTPQAFTTGVWLVLADRHGVGEAVADLLRARGATVRLASAGQVFRRRTADRWELPVGDEEAYRRLLRQVAGEGTPCRGVLHLFSLDGATTRETTAESVARDQELGGESVLLLSRALIEEKLPGSPRLWLFTRGAVMVGEDRTISTGQAPLWGLGRTLPWEHPELGSTLVDVEEGVAPERLVAELLDPDREEQVAVRASGRFVARLSRAEPPADRAPPRLQSDGAYLITGGLGGLGLSVAQWMVERGARHLALMGRSDPSEAARSAIARMEQAGAKLLVLAADVSRAEQVTEALSRVRAEFGPLRGVVHAAGVLDDGTVLTLSVESMRNVAAPKVMGAIHLHEATRADVLDFFVLYSSVASLTGSAGASGYAAANAFLDALACERRSRGLPALSVSWGPFAEVGLAAAQAHRGARMAGMGFTAIAPAEGNAALGELLASSSPHVGVVPMNLELLVASAPRIPTSPVFSKLVEEVRGAPQTDVRASALAEILAAPPDERRSLAERWIREEVGKLLRHDPTSITPSERLVRYGFDSLMSIELRNRLRALCGIEFSIADIVTNPSTEALAALLAGRLGHPGERADMVEQTGSATGSWVVRLRPAPDAKLRLICFPYAGGGAPVFAGWPSGLPTEIEVLAIQPPGRLERLREPLITNFEEVIAEMVPALLPYLDRPFAFFGHCLGAITGFEVARVLAEKHGLRPVHFFASGAAEPRQYLVTGGSGGDDRSFLDHLRFIGFVREEVLASDDAVSHLLPPVKADFEVAANYRYRPGTPLDVPVTAFAGRDDPFGTPHIMEGWREHTSMRSSMSVFSGEHYFIETERPAILRIIGGELLGALAVLGQRMSLASGSSSACAPGQRSGVAPEREVDDTRTPLGLSRPTPRPAARTRLFCFPGLGGSAYERWASAFHEDVEVCILQLPGRGARGDELPLCRVDDVVEYVGATIRAQLDRPFAFFGHDLGATVLFELTRALRRSGAPLPSHLFVGSAKAPPFSSLPPLHHWPAQKLFTLLRHMGVSFEESESAERPLRAECAMMWSYRFAPEPPLDIPITAFIAEQGRTVSRESAGAWAAMTTVGFSLEVCGGGDLVADLPVPLRRRITGSLTATSSWKPASAPSPTLVVPAAR